MRDLRILVASKFWYRRGGLERVMMDEVSWLEASGHQTAHFSMQHPENDPSPWASYFVPYLELGGHGHLSPGQKIQAVARMFNNREAARRFDSMLNDFEPDLIHIHGVTRHMSPSILWVARRRHVPVVQTLHDYHHVCPTDTLLRRDGAVCEPRRCGKYWYGQAVVGRCLRGSRTASMLSAAETTYSRITGAYERSVCRFISPSRFLAGVIRAGGWDLPIDVVPNAVPVMPSRTGTGRAFAVIGRLSAEKGVEVALEAARKIGSPITVAGDGPLRQQLEQAYPEARFTGRLSADDVSDLVSVSRAVVVPSLWFENASMSILETMSAGVPVVASRIGGIPEQVTDGLNGLLVPPGEVDALADALQRLSSDEAFAKRLGDAAQEKVSRVFSPQRHLKGMLQSYALAVESNQLGRHH